MDECMIIGGRSAAAASGERIEVRNPARPTQVVGSIPRAAAVDVDRAVMAAEQALPGWAATPIDERITMLAKGADAVLPDIVELAALLTSEMGKIASESLADVGTADFMLRSLPPQALGVVAGQRISDEFGTVNVVARAIGVVGVIVPWNWPPALASVRLAEALSTGNTVVCLPSPYASLAVAGCIARIAAALPPGVVNVITGFGPEAGAALTSHDRVRKISFTGGAKTGREVLIAAAGNFKTPSMELGGNDAAIFLDDVRVDDALAAALLQASMTTAGQICVAAKRVYVAAARHDELVEAFAAAADRIVVGDGADPQVTMGPLVNAVQAARFDRFLAEARDRGATVHELGTRSAGLDADGHFRQPHVVTGVDHTFGIVSDEQFGPATPFIPFDEVEDAITQANATEFGLGASVWSSDVARARAVAERLEAGMVFLNRHDIPGVHPHGIFGGVKQSGIGRELGRWGIESYTETCEIIDPAPAS